MICIFVIHKINHKSKLSFSISNQVNRKGVDIMILNRNILITGANGFIGKTLVNTLIKRHYSIIALDTKFDEELMNNDLVKCINVSNKGISDVIKEIPSRDYECLYHFAWVGTSGAARADYNIQLNNVKLTCDYIQLCKKIKCKRIIYASSINEMETYEYLQLDDIEPMGGYIYGTGKLAAHLMGETFAMLNHIEFIPVIITNIYGAGEKSARLIYTTINKLIQKKHCSFTSGEQMYDFIYITDAINAIIEISEKGKAFNRYYIGSGSPKPLKDFLNELKNIVDPTAELGLGELSFKGKDISYDQFELKKVERDTGYKNQISFSEGIEMTAEYIRKESKL